MARIDLDEFLECARNAVVAGGDILLRLFGGREELNARQKEDGTIQTDADVESERAVLDALIRYKQTCAIYAEEGGFGWMHDSSYVIMVDPLDGTSNYFRNRGGFGVSAAIAEMTDGRPDLRAVATLDPTTRQLWTAIKGSGCYLEFVGSGRRRRVHVSPKRPREGDLCLDASTLGRLPIKSAHHKAMIVEGLMPIYRRFRMLGSNVLAHALVANGSFEAAVTDTVGGPFDVAGVLLVTEAGGVATDIAGNDVDVFRNKIVVSSNGRGHDELLVALRRLYKTPI
jgi:myo-inositol-1(or 4)-monophosphatase